MQAGFGLLEAGFVRSKNVVNIMAENLMDTTMTTVGFILLGFGLMFGSGNAFFGTEWFALQGVPTVYPGLTIHPPGDRPALASRSPPRRGYYPRLEPIGRTC